MATAATAVDVNNLFVFVAACLVFFMHTGFAMLEAGGVQAKNRQAILIKNVTLVATSALSWWALGYLLSGGNNSESVFLGRSDGSTTNAFLKDVAKTGSDYITWFFGFAFAATSATIVSGAVAERVNFKAYLIYSVVLTGVVYPIVAYWGWSGKGWLIQAGDDKNSNNGYVDFAGSGIVHMVGGCAGLIGAIVVGPRRFLSAGKDKNGDDVYLPRFGENGEINSPAMESSSTPLSALGTLILWLGWFGFNPGSAYGIAGKEAGTTVGLALVNTVLSPSAAAVTYLVFGAVRGEPDLNGILNSVLGGLVAITAGCHWVEPWAAVLIGVVATFVYVGSSKLLRMLQVDDVIDAAPVHYFCGMWGLVAVGLFVSDKLCGDHAPGLFYGGGRLLGWQVVGILVISGWTAVITAACLVPLHFVNWLRVSEEEEKLGLDMMLTKVTKEAADSNQSATSTREDPNVKNHVELCVVEEAQKATVDKEEPNRAGCF